MAVLNTYVSPAINSAGLVNNPPGTPLAFNANGTRVLAMYMNWTIAASDSNGSIYRLFKALDPNLIPLHISIGNQAMAGSTSFQLGLYNTNSAAGFGTIVGTGNQFVANGSLANAHTSVSDPANWLYGLSAIPQFTRSQRLFEIAGETEIAPTIATTRRDGFDLCLTGTTLGGVAGQVEVLAVFAQG